MTEKRSILADQNGFFQMLRNRPVGRPDLLTRRPNSFLLVFLVAEFHERRSFWIRLLEDVDIRQRRIKIGDPGDHSCDDDAFKENSSHKLLRRPAPSTSSKIPV